MQYTYVKSPELKRMILLGNSLGYDIGRNVLKPFYTKEEFWRTY